VKQPKGINNKRAIKIYINQQMDWQWFQDFQKALTIDRPLNKNEKT